MEQGEYLFRFREHLKALNRTEATVSTYSDTIRQYLRALKVDIRQVSAGDMEAYVAALFTHRTKENKQYTTGTIITKVRALKRFFEYLEHANHIFINPMEAIREPKKDKTLPRNVLTVREVRKILDQPNLSTRTGIRDRTVLELFYSTGIRLNELCRLTIFDADLQGGMLRINQGKGQKDRVVPMGTHAVRFLREYITKVRPRYAKKNPRNRSLIVDRYGTPISTQVVGILVRTYAREAKIRKKVSPHTFRHTFATELVKNGADILAVQKMLGHVCLTTTQQYIRSLGLDLKKAHATSHPREQDTVRQHVVTPQVARIREHYATRRPRASKR